MSPRPNPIGRPTNATTGPRPAEPAPAASGRSAPRVVGRKAVPSALRSDPHTVTVTGIQPGLRIRFPRVPVADWLCSCGHHERATGRTAVAELAGRVQVGACPHRAPAAGTTERTAA